MRKARPAANPCIACGRHYESQYPDPRRKYCSLTCASTARRASKSRVCLTCGKEVAFDDFPLVDGKRTRACADCYRPRNAPRPVVNAPAPCKECGKVFGERRPPSRMKRRLYCSIACSRIHLQIPERLCQGCRKVLPRDHFGPSNSGRRSLVCQACWEAKELVVERGIGFMVPFSVAYQTACATAGRRSVGFGLSKEEAVEMYGTPCDYCGAPGCVFRPLTPGGDYGQGNVGVCCWLCAKVAQVRRGGINTNDMLLYARAILRHLEA